MKVMVYGGYGDNGNDGGYMVVWSVVMMHGGCR